MRLIKAAGGILNQTPMAWESNKQNILAAIGAARIQGVSVLCLPELCISGYGCEDAFHSPGLQRVAQEVLLEIVPHTQGLIVALSLPVLHDGELINAACLIVDGRIAGFVGKQNLAGEGIHYEPRWFRPWPEGEHATTRIAGQNYPIGDLLFDVGGVRIGFEICEDAWVPDRPGGKLARHGVDIILNPSASHFAFGKHEVRKRYVLEGSRAFHCNYILSNLLGNEAGRVIYDGGALIASDGRLLTMGPRFSFADWQITSALIDLDSTRMARSRGSGFRRASDEDDDKLHIVNVDFNFPDLPPEEIVPQSDPWETEKYVKEEEFARAEALGLFDYMRKSRSRGWVVSISGGADSAAVTVLSALSIQLAQRELGREILQKKLAHVPNIETAKDEQEIVGRLLACVYQATRNSGQTTLDAARTVAEGIGAEFLQFNVDPLFEGYVSMVSQGIGREINWQQDDVALQNIQARVRSPGVWMLANIRGALLLATSNRSEAAVGYATMDGDTSGGLSPIAGIDKAYLRRWLVWMEQHGPHGVGPLPALYPVNQLVPTAELRPSSAGQTDEDDLMPYDLLDSIERAAIRDKKMPLDVYRLMSIRYPKYTSQQMVIWVERFFRLWCRNQWKRERYAPSFHLDDENLDPKTWCRFPILSGGYERELAELHAFVKKA